ncbi:glycosyltransferase family 2 protein [Neorhizobium galegae]|uniref:glycosyltransferase family 2 protein n=1 Tax=Neorhizobium galegae TaxID=399 RepID=UPI00127E4EA1|nr:glycosyltransferase family 2 protein [Neorhizobium galegae]KAA9383388.1 glycosyltransferase family 2 protein [Neorhizobium galegae]MCM2500266.1 glycosyltransferase family 2 protein [Neorhizobium galegae]MCQ1770797.1 glycosyltransferase family 2 protein [Neorhizobium galegae]
MSGENKQAPHASSPLSPEGRHPIDASFIVCTRNRAAALEACISSIEAACQACSLSCELVVVDNGSTDDTAIRLSRIAAKSAVPVRWMVELRPGLAAARNTGMERARGRLLIFIDDDCVVETSYLQDLNRHYSAGERCIVRGGRVDLGSPHDLPFTIKRSRFRARFTPDVHPGGFVLGCNMTMHREAAARIGRFDERFGAGGPLRSAEDTDYLVRAYQLGIPIEYVPDMTVQHFHGRTTRDAIEQLHRDYSFGNGGLCVKHVFKAPWLLRHFCWTTRSAWRELFGGYRFDPEISLSHLTIVVMNLVGAAKFALLAIRWPKQADADTTSHLRRPQRGSPPC